MAHGQDSLLDMPRTASADESCAEAPDFEHFFREHYRSLLQFLRRRSQTPEDAEDAAQESLTRFIRYTGTEPVAAWKPTLYRIAINVLNDRTRRAQSHRAGKHVPFDDLQLESEQPTAEDAAVRAQQLALLREAILALPPKCRQVYLLKRLRGWTNAAIARHCGISVKMVEKHAANGIQHIRRRLGQLPPDAY